MDQESVQGSARGQLAQSQCFLVTRNSKRRNSKPLLLFLWTEGDADSMLSQTAIFLGWKADQGNRRDLAGLEAGEAAGWRHSALKNVG